MNQFDWDFSDSTAAAILCAVVKQVVIDYHKWKSAKKPGQFSFDGWRAQQWLLGEDFGGLRFEQFAELMGHDRHALARRLMRPAAYRALKPKNAKWHKMHDSEQQILDAD